MVIILVIVIALIIISKNRKYVFHAPSGMTWNLFTDMLSRPHLLIAGTTGSGKSVSINGLISTLLYRCPTDSIDDKGNPGAQMIMIDPKRVELAKYAKLPHTLAHAAGQDPTAWRQAIDRAIAIMDDRYKYMERKKLTLYDKGDLYVIIDEWASLYKNKEYGKEAYKSVLRLTSEGRAAKVHVIMATQIPKANIIPTEIRENFDARLCLRTANSLQSRVIMDENGCETLPYPPDAGYANGYYLKAGKAQLYTIPYVKEDEIDTLLQWWNDPAHKKPIL